jgi:hypothetical protein
LFPYAVACADEHNLRLAVIGHDIRSETGELKNQYFWKVKLVLTNLSEHACCFLPTEVNTSYSILFDGKIFDSYIWGSDKARWPKPKLATDLNLATVVIEPHCVNQIEIQEETLHPIKLASKSGTFLFMVCCVFDEDSYRGVEVYKKKIELEARFKLRYNEHDHTWIFDE